MLRSLLSNREVMRNSFRPFEGKKDILSPLPNLLFYLSLKKPFFHWEGIGVAAHLQVESLMTSPPISWADEMGSSKKVEGRSSNIPLSPSP